VRLPKERWRPASASERSVWVGGEHAQHGREVAVLEFEAVALEMFVVGENLLGTLDIRRGAFDLNGVGKEVDGDVHAFFKQPEILVAGTEESLDIGRDLDILLHQMLELPSIRSAPKAQLRWLTYLPFESEKDSEVGTEALRPPALKTATIVHRVRRSGLRVNEDVADQSTLLSR